MTLIHRVITPFSSKTRNEFPYKITIVFTNFSTTFKAAKMNSWVTIASASLDVIGAFGVF